MNKIYIFYGDTKGHAGGGAYQLVGPFASYEDKEITQVLNTIRKKRAWPAMQIAGTLLLGVDDVQTGTILINRKHSTRQVYALCCKDWSLKQGGVLGNDYLTVSCIKGEQGAMMWARWCSVSLSLLACIRPSWVELGALSVVDAWYRGWLFLQKDAEDTLAWQVLWVCHEKYVLVIVGYAGCVIGSFLLYWREIEADEGVSGLHKTQARLRGQFGCNQYFMLGLLGIHDSVEAAISRHWSGQGGRVQRLDGLWSTWCSWLKLGEIDLAYWGAWLLSQDAL